MQQRPFEREALTHAARKATTRCRRRGPRAPRAPAPARRLSSRVEVRTAARRTPDSGAPSARGTDAVRARGGRCGRERRARDSSPSTAAVADRAARRRDERGQHADQRGFAGAVRPEQSEDVAAVDGERHMRDGAAPAEMTRDVGQLDASEIDTVDTLRTPRADRAARSLRARCRQRLASSVSSAPYTCSSAASELLAARRIARAIAAAVPLIVLEPHKFLKEFLAAARRAACARPFPSAAATGLVVEPRCQRARCRARASARSIAARRCGAAAPTASAPTVCPAAIVPPSPTMASSPFAVGMSCWRVDLRRRQLDVAELADDDGDVAERRRKALRDLQ